jgi:hypothetical protein
MPRAKKTRPEPPEEGSELDAKTEPAEPAAEAPESEESRPSQLEQIRSAISGPAEPELTATAEAPELPAPTEAPELPAPEPEPEPEPEPQAAAAATAAEPVVVPATPAAVAIAPMPPPPTTPPPPAAPPAPPPPPIPGARRAGPGTSIALGIVLVVVGLFFLVVRLFDIDLSTYGWPLFVIIPGLTLLVVGFISLGTGALVPGGIVTITGLVLAYQNSTGDWASWAYAWALVAPGGVGLGIYLQGLRNRNPKLVRQGSGLMFWSAMIFFIGFVLFESIFKISGTDYGYFGKAALPALLIIIGVTLLIRSIQRSRRA